MTYPELVECVAQRLGWTQKKTREAMDALFRVLSEAAAREKLWVPGFGVFEPGQQKARQVVDPNDTTKRLELPTNYRVKFRAAKELKEQAAKAASIGRRGT